MQEIRGKKLRGAQNSNSALILITSLNGGGVCCYAGKRETKELIGITPLIGHKNLPLPVYRLQIRNLQW